MSPSRKPPHHPYEGSYEPIVVPKEAFWSLFASHTSVCGCSPPSPWGARLPCCRVGLYPLAHEWFLHHDDMCYTTFVRFRKAESKGKAQNAKHGMHKTALDPHWQHLHHYVQEHRVAELSWFQQNCYDYGLG